jgi:NAD(P)-dependent dehydrogenase (short-subunit alcohol dehydrogenase family)
MKPSSYNPFYKWLILLTIGLSSAHASQALRADGRSPPGCDSGKRKRSSWHFLGSRCSRWTSPIVTQIESAATRAVTGGGVDVVFNNAGYGMSGPLEGLTDEQILRVVNTNLLGTIRTTKAFILYLRQRKEGLFINTTSIGGLFTVTFNSVYHATKWALEGWSESMAFELNQLGIGMKIVEPGGMRTDCFTRSLDVGRHPAYDALLDSVMGAITDPKQMETFSTPDQVAEVVDEAATDGKDQLRYVAGTDAKAIYATRLQLGDEAFRGAIGQQFFGRQATIIGP